MESPESKGLREDVESLERQLAAARARHADRQQAKAAAANDGDDDAPMPPIQELAVEDAADAAAQPKGSSDESSDDDLRRDDLRRVAQRQGDDTTAQRSRPATPVVARDLFAEDWGRHPKAWELWEHRQSQLPPEETGKILQLYVQRESGVKLDGWSFADPYACYKDSKGRHDALLRVANHCAALDAAEELRKRCDLCSIVLRRVDDFEVGDRVKVADQRGVVMALPQNSYWRVRFDGQSEERPVRTGEFTSLDGSAAVGTCFRLGCRRRRCASCHAVNPLKAPLLCQECPTDIYFPDDVQTAFPAGAPKLFAAWSLKDDFLAELQKKSPDPHAVIRYLRRDLDYLGRPTGIHLSDPLCMTALKERLLRAHGVGRYLGDRFIGATAWRVCETVEES